MGSDLLTHAFFACASRRAARALAAPGRAPRVFLYEFSLDLSQWPEVAALPELGNYHTSELDFVFGNSWPAFLHGRNFTKQEEFMVEAIQGYWANFVVSGDPNVGASPPPLQWPAFAPGAASGDEASVQLELPLSVRERNYDEVCSGVWDPFAAALEQGAPRAQQPWAAHRLLPCAQRGSAH